MIRVVHVIWSIKFGGIEKLVFDLIKQQEKNKFLKVELLICKKEEETIEKIAASGISHRYVNLKSGMDFSFSAFRKMKIIFKSVDIIHFHAFNPLTAWAAASSGKKIFYTEHGNFGFGRKRKFGDPINLFFLRRFLKKSVAFISFNSLFTRSFALKRYRLKDNVGKMIYNGIDLSLQLQNQPIDDEWRKRFSGKFVVGTSSRFAGFKRIDRLIKAFAKFTINEDTVLLLVGDGVLMPNLKKLVEELQLNNKVFFAGYRENVGAFQQLMDVCVFPSENEPFGLVAVETLSLGKPTIVFRDGGGIIEIVEEISPDDVVEDEHHLVERLNFYFSNRAELTNNSNARKLYAGRFDIRVMEEIFYGEYKKMIEEK